MVYVFSDPHFDSENIIHLTHRPFKTVEEMNATLIRNYNMVVRKQDTCYWLGDVMYGPTKEKVRAILSQMHGRKYLVRGNHDKRHSEKWWKEAGFDKVYTHPIYDQKRHVILSHEPLKEFSNIPGVANFHGHIHSNGYDFKGHKHCVNTCVENTDYRPIPLINPFISAIIDSKKRTK